MYCSVVAEGDALSPFHKHMQHELIICLNSHGVLEINGRFYDYRVGRTFLIPAGVERSVRSRSDGVALSQFICFDDTFATALGILALANYLTPNYLNHSVCSAVAWDVYSENRSLGCNLQKEFDLPSTFSDVLIKSFLIQLLVNHCRLAEIPSLVKRNSKSFRIERCCDYIVQDPARVITLESMAEMAGMSRSYFSQHFKQVTGKSLIEFVNMVRLQKACQLLIYGEESATNIAYSCGFGNLGHFYTVFKKQYQMTPRDYRHWVAEQRKTISAQSV